MNLLEQLRDLGPNYGTYMWTAHDGRARGPYSIDSFERLVEVAPHDIAEEYDFDTQFCNLVTDWEVKKVAEKLGYEGGGEIIVGDVISITHKPTGVTEFYARYGYYNSWDYDLGEYKLASSYEKTEKIITLDVIKVEFADGEKITYGV